MTSFLYEKNRKTQISTVGDSRRQVYERRIYKFFLCIKLDFFFSVKMLVKNHKSSFKNAAMSLLLCAELLFEVQCKNFFPSDISLFNEIYAEITIQGFCTNIGRNSNIHTIFSHKIKSVVSFEMLAFFPCRIPSKKINDNIELQLTHYLLTF